MALGAANEYEDVRITATDRNLNISEGGVAEMECTARGTPRPDIIWVKVDSNEKVRCHGTVSLGICLNFISKQSQS